MVECGAQGRQFRVEFLAHLIKIVDAGRPGVREAALNEVYRAPSIGA